MERESSSLSHFIVVSYTVKQFHLRWFNSAAETLRFRQTMCCVIHDAGMTDENFNKKPSSPKKARKSQTDYLKARKNSNFVVLLFF